MSALLDEAVAVATEMIKDGRVQEVKDFLHRQNRRRIVEMNDEELIVFISMFKPEPLEQPTAGPMFPGSIDV